MTWYAVFYRESGALYSVGSSIANPLPEEFDFVQMDEQPDPRDWDESERVFVTQINAPVETEIDPPVETDYA